MFGKLPSRPVAYKSSIHSHLEAEMSLSIAYTNSDLPVEKSYPDSQTLLRKRTLRQTTSMYRLGQQVLVSGMPATVIAYNIAAFGRWISGRHPVVVRLQTGEVLYCRLSDLNIAENPSMQVQSAYL
ncbi:MAG TPA: hypothetical protein VFV28_03845 [Limnobacter sp.]|nr:hypothetical protein [Limnobacter sp.]